MCAHFSHSILCSKMSIQKMNVMKYYNRVIRGLVLEFERFGFTESTDTKKGGVWFLLFFLELRRWYELCYCMGGLSPQQFYLRISWASVLLRSTNLCQTEPLCISNQRISKVLSFSQPTCEPWRPLPFCGRYWVQGTRTIFPSGPVFGFSL